MNWQTLMRIASTLVLSAARKRDGGVQVATTMCATFERDAGYYIIDNDSDDTVVCKSTCHITFHLEALERDASQDDVPSVTPSLDRR